MPNNGFYRIACAVPRLHLADAASNAQELASIYSEAVKAGASIVITPELSITGATCGNLFQSRQLADAATNALECLAKATAGHSTALLVGLPVMHLSQVFNCAALLQDGKIVALTAASGRAEFFSQPERQNETLVQINGQEIPISTNAVYDAGNGFIFGIEIGNKADAPIPPAASFALNGAQAIFSMRAVTETISTTDSLRTAAASQSERLLALYATVSSGVHESTADIVCAGHAIVAAGGEILAENTPFARESTITYTDFIPHWMDAMRMARSFPHCSSYAVIHLPAQLPSPEAPQHMHLSTLPFVPDDAAKRTELCKCALDIQASALARRVEATHSKRLVLGISGGLDSTLALMVCARCCDMLSLPRTFILALTLPGMGTSGRTKNNALGIANDIGAELREISIKNAVMQHFQDIGHDPEKMDVVYENSQARERTQILMDLANQEGGLLVGTGDLSEIAMGWCTFNGDHMSMYSVNGSIPKTLMRCMIEQLASESSPELAAHLRDINATPISPELLPGAQHTEAIIGNYDLHDFFLYHFIRHGSTAEELQILASQAFKDVYPQEKISSTLQVFLKRFFTQQFKRNAMPDGPKVTDISLSPRGEWNMPSDMSPAPWLSTLSTNK